LIKISIWLDNAGLFSGIKATGHSGAAAAGQDIVCASVSILLRTLARSLEQKEGFILNGSADVRGDFFLEIDVDKDGLSGWLEGLTAFIVTGLKDLEEEYPRYCSVNIDKR